MSNQCRPRNPGLWCIKSSTQIILWSFFSVHSVNLYNGWWFWLSENVIVSLVSDKTMWQWLIYFNSIIFQSGEGMRQVRLRLAACQTKAHGEMMSDLPGGPWNISSTKHVSICLIFVPLFRAHGSYCCLAACTLCTLIRKHQGLYTYFPLHPPESWNSYAEKRAGYGGAGGCSRSRGCLSFHQPTPMSPR